MITTPSTPGTPDIGRREVSLAVTICAYAVPFCILPSALWRLIGATGDNPCSSGSLAEAIYVPSLSFVSLGLGWLTVGLVRPWGEVVPRWVPMLGGRRVNPRAVAAAAYSGAALIVLITLWPMTLGSTEPRRELAPGCHQPGWEVLRWYLPLLLWAPLLTIVARSYQLRHRPRVPQSTQTKPVS